MFVVLHAFKDLQDNRYSYKEGDMYPREGYAPTEARIEELSGENNNLWTPLIKQVAEKAAKDGDNHNNRFTKRNNERSVGRVIR